MMMYSTDKKVFQTFPVPKQGLDIYAYFDFSFQPLIYYKQRSLKGEKRYMETNTYRQKIRCYIMSKGPQLNQ